MYSSGLAQLLLFSMLATAALALWKGDTAVRIGATVIVIVNAAAIPMIQHAIAGDAGEVALVIEDLVASVCLLFLAVRYASLWIGGVMLLQAGQFTLHSYYLVEELPHDRLHAWINNLDDWAIIGCILAGTISAWRRRVRLRREAAARELRDGTATKN